MEWFFCLIAVMVTAIFAAFWAWQYQRRKKALMKRIRSVRAGTRQRKTAKGHRPALGDLEKRGLFHRGRSDLERFGNG